MHALELAFQKTLGVYLAPLDYEKRKYFVCYFGHFFNSR